jgi:hypothetical protein
MQPAARERKAGLRVMRLITAMEVSYYDEVITVVQDSQT